MENVKLSIQQHIHKYFPIEKVEQRYPWIKNAGIDNKTIETRVERDIDCIIDRLMKWEYYLRDFSPMRKFEVVWRMKEFYLYLNGYTKSWKDWANVFEMIGISSNHSVLNVWPWWSPKVELGLYQNGFEWTITICDIDKKSSQHIKSFMEIFRHHITFKQKTCNFLNWNCGKFDILCANHVIDDIIVCDYLQRHNLDISDYYDEEKTIEITTLMMQQDFSIIDNLTDVLVYQINKHTKKWWTVCFNHYVSYIDEMFDNHSFYNYCKKVLQLTAKKLCNLWYTAIQQPKWLSRIYFPKNSFFILEKTHDISR